ncbi:MAG TPA: DUF1405 domain-containing protein [Symbiobacteriaceae bacterium]|nr:DUF1405 domain-containing protein [Symbiobacteriaceae bacterium]
MTILRSFFTAVARERRFWWILLIINFFGSLYGFWWYKGQLLATPAKYWLIVPDSPGSTFLLFIWLALMIAGVDWRKPGMQWLGAVAFVSNMKYGLWTATVLPQAGFKFGWEFDFIHLSLSHAGMWLQAMIFARFYKPGLVPAMGALLFMWFQDLIDYFILGTYPTLPYESELAYARGMAILLSTMWGGFLVWQARFDRKESRA